MNRPSPRVVVTGIGLVTGLGGDAESSWSALRAGRSALRRLDFPRSPALIGAPAALDLSPTGDRTGALQDRAIREALHSAGLGADGRPYDPHQVATIVGLSKGRIVDLIESAGASPARPWVESWPGDGSSRASRLGPFRGPSLAPVAACATGLVGVLQGANMLRWGDCDLVIAGAADASLHPFLLGAFRNMRVLAETPDPTRAIRPWNRDRAGFAAGEGAAILILERDDRARARGATPLAEVAGGAIGSDAYHLTDLNPDPRNLAGLIGHALDHAGVYPEEIDHVNVHGTATAANDPLECRALRLALGSRADQVSCSANKPQIGHLLGAAGAVELAFACLALRDQFVPPTLNLDDPDPACDLDGTPHVGRAREIRAALKLSIGFGGHLAVAVLRRAGESPR